MASLRLPEFTKEYAFAPAQSLDEAGQTLFYSLKGPRGRLFEIVPAKADAPLRIAADVKDYDNDKGSLVSFDGCSEEVVRYFEELQKRAEKLLPKEQLAGKKIASLFDGRMLCCKTHVKTVRVCNVDKKRMKDFPLEDWRGSSVVPLLEFTGALVTESDWRICVRMTQMMLVESGEGCGF